MITELTPGRVQEQQQQNDKINELITVVNRLEVMIGKMQRRYALMTGLMDAPHRPPESPEMVADRASQARDVTGG